MESILTSVKKMLGIDDTYEYFDADIIMHINSVFMILNQLGVGPESPFGIEDDTSEWQDFSEDIGFIQLVKTYMFMKVKLMFDPPQSSSAVEALNRQISEFEWRLNVQVDPKEI